MAARQAEERRSRRRDRAGRDVATFGVDDMDDEVAPLAKRGLDLGAIDMGPGKFRIATIADTDGNTIAFAQDLRSGH